MQPLMLNQVYEVSISDYPKEVVESYRNNRVLGLSLANMLPAWFENITHADDKETDFFVDGAPVLARTRTEKTINMAPAKMKGAGRFYSHAETLEHLKQYQGVIIVKNVDDVLYIRLIPMQLLLPYVGERGDVTREGIDRLFNAPVTV